MAQKLLKFLSPTIRSRLSLSFFIVAFIAVCSAATAWLLMSESERQSRKLLNTTMPLVSGSQALGKEIAFFTTFSKDLSKLTSTTQHQEIMSALKERIDEIHLQLEMLQNHGVDAEDITGMQGKVSILVENLHDQEKLIAEYLHIQQKLSKALSHLENKHSAFNSTIRPRIADNYKDFVHQGKEVTNQIQHALNDTTQTSQAQDNSIRVGIETLVNTVAGELRGNHEIIAATFESTGLMYAAASVDTQERIDELQETFDDLLPLVKRLQLILSYTTPENSRVLLSALPIFKSGQGEGSIFELRKQELDLREQVAVLTDNSIEITTAFSNLARQLSESHRKAAEQDLMDLNKYREQAKLIQVIAGIAVLSVSILIGWYYVGSRVISRIEKLKETMHDHAQGISGTIPLDGDDEITDMTRALQSFVIQRSKVEGILQQNVELLNEAQQIAKFGSCIRHEKDMSWEWSDGFYSLIGYQSNDKASSGNDFWSVIHPEDREKVHNKIGGFSQSQEQRTLDFRLLRADGTTCSVSTRWKYSPGEEDKTGILHGTLLDVTERKRIESELSKIQKLESIGVLAGGIAHDFNNLLTAILGNTSLASMELSNNPEAKHYLRLAENAAFRARDLTKRLLTFAKGGDPVKAVSNLQDILVEAVEFALHGSNVKCIWKIPDNLWPVDIDAGQVNQVIQNLVLNADQAMPQGGVLTVFCSNMFVDSEDLLQLVPGHYVKIDIQDQGYGIPIENLKRIFDPYFTTKEMDSNKGSGLGLAIVHSIIQKHGGHIEVQSTVGSGTTFTLYLPALPDATKSSPKNAHKIDATSSGSVLVMDDEEIVRSVVDSMLKKLGYEVLLTADGLEAVTLYETLLAGQNKPDVVLMDLTVPGGMGGRKAAELILKKDPSAKIIVSSGYSNEDILLHYKDFGFQGVASKPYDLTELSRVIAEVMG